MENNFNFNDLDFRVPDIESIRHRDLINNVESTAELLKEQNKILLEQLEKEKENVKKLQELNDIKNQEIENQKIESRKLRTYNRIMGGISVFSLLLAIASLVCSIVLG